MTAIVSPEVNLKSLSDRPSINQLTQIRGIGSIKKRWLYAIEIYSIEQLANCRTSELEKQLKAIGHPVSVSEIESWITQAQAFFAAPEAASSTNQKSLAESPQGSSPEKIAKPEQSHLSDSNSWQSVAFFEMELQQRSIGGKLEWRSIVHHRASQTAILWADASLEQFQQWIQQEMPLAANSTESLGSEAIDSLSEDLSPAVSAPEPAQPVEPPIAVTLTQVRLWDSSQTGCQTPMVIDPQQRMARSIAANVPFSLEVNFDLAMQSIGVDCRSQSEHAKDTSINTLSKTSTKQWVYRIECRAKHLGTGQTFCLGDLEANVPLCQNALYGAVLDNLSFPLVGVYRVQISLTSETLPVLPAVFKIPFVQVETASVATHS